MMNTLMKFKTPIIFAFVVLLCFYVYSQFFAPSPAAIGTSGLVQTSATDSGTSTAQGDAFVTQLLTLQNITFDTSLLTDPAFEQLVDFSRPLVDQAKGRSNPFAPINGVSSSPSVTGTTAATSSSTATPAKSS